MFHSRTLNKHINKIHERAMRLVYDDNVSSFEEFLNKDNSFMKETSRVLPLGSVK